MLILIAFVLIVIFYVVGICCVINILWQSSKPTPEETKEKQEWDEFVKNYSTKLSAILSKHFIFRSFEDEFVNIGLTYGTMKFCWQVPLDIMSVRKNVLYMWRIDNIEYIIKDYEKYNKGQ